MDEILDDDNLENERTSSKRRQWFYNLLIITLIGFGISTAVSWIVIESILLSGPTMLIVGIILLVISVKLKNNSGIIMGLIAPALTIFWLTIINYYALRPHECEVTVPSSLTFFTLVVLLLTLALYSKKNSAN